MVPVGRCAWSKTSSGTLSRRIVHEFKIYWELVTYIKAVPEWLSFPFCSLATWSVSVESPAAAATVTTVGAFRPTRRRQQVGALDAARGAC